MLKVSGLVKVSDGELQNSLRLGDVIITGSSENIDEVAYTSVVTRAFDEPTYLNSFCFGIRLNHPEMFEPDFLAHLLRSSDVRTRFTKTANGVTRYNVSKPALLKVRIPVPPLEVQREIVRILDGFTKLEAELEARRKQYVFYRDQLLTFTPEGGRTKWLALGEIATLGTGTRNSNWGHLEGTYPFFTRGQEILRQEQYDFDEIAIITAGDGVGVGKVMHYFEGKYALHQRAYRIVIHSKSIVPKFIYHYMRTDFLRYMTKESVHGSVLSVRKRMLEHYPVPVPPLEEQRRIVAILDKFDALVNGISSGLPAEIEARRKQYEHYRDRLLTFPELNG
ncbi:restriction endonuclease subunit S [Trueperella pyogenes]|uniref:restriction endonuclease subunit S n=1 Tax=Trueperella pyogenes TaxID=1661 RepID=UPI00345CA613